MVVIVLPAARDDRQAAAALRHAVDVHRAGAAEVAAAAELGAFEVEEVAQDPEQRHLRWRVDRLRRAVEGEFDGHRVLLGGSVVVGSEKSSGFRSVERRQEHRRALMQIPFEEANLGGESQRGAAAQPLGAGPVVGAVAAEPRHDFGTRRLPVLVAGVPHHRCRPRRVGALAPASVAPAAAFCRSCSNCGG